MGLMHNVVQEQTLLVVLAGIQDHHIRTVAVAPVDCIVDASAATLMPLRVIHNPFAP